MRCACCLEREGSSEPADGDKVREKPGHTKQRMDLGGAEPQSCRPALTFDSSKRRHIRSIRKLGRICNFFCRCTFSAPRNSPDFLSATCESLIAWRRWCRFPAGFPRLCTAILVLRCVSESRAAVLVSPRRPPLRSFQIPSQSQTPLRIPLMLVHPHPLPCHSPMGLCIAQIRCSRPPDWLCSDATSSRTHSSQC